MSSPTETANEAVTSAEPARRSASKPTGTRGRSTDEVFASSRAITSSETSERSGAKYDRFVSARCDNSINAPPYATDTRPLFEILQEARDRNAEELALKNNPAILPQVELDEADAEFLQVIEEREKSLRSALRSEEDEELDKFRRQRASIVYDVADLGLVTSEPVQHSNAIVDLKASSAPIATAPTPVTSESNRLNRSAASKIFRGRLVVRKKRKLESDYRTEQCSGKSPAVSPTTTRRKSAEHVPVAIKTKQDAGLVSYEGDSSSSSSSPSLEGARS